MSKKSSKPENKKDEEGKDVVHSVPLEGLYKDWFLDYASYVILERAVPRIEDGFKPVQPPNHACAEGDGRRPLQ